MCKKVFHTFSSLSNQAIRPRDQPLPLTHRREIRGILGHERPLCRWSEIQQTRRRFNRSANAARKTRPSPETSPGRQAVKNNCH